MEIGEVVWATRFVRLMTDVGPFGAGMLADLLDVEYAVGGQADAIVAWDVRSLARDKVRKALQVVCRCEGLTPPLIGRPGEVIEWLGLKT